MWLRETIQHTVSTYSHLLIGRLGIPVHHLIDILKEALPTSDITPNLKATKMSLYGRIPELQSAQESCLSATAAGLITFWHKDFSSPNFHYLHILFYTNQATAKHTSMSLPVTKWVWYQHVLFTVSFFHLQFHILYSTFTNHSSWITTINICEKR